MPEDSNPDLLVGHHDGLVDEALAVLLHLGEDLVGGRLARGRAGLAGHGERIDEGLGMVLAHVGEQLVDEPTDERAGRVDASNQLWYDLQPGVDVDGAEALRSGPRTCPCSGRSRTTGSVGAVHPKTKFKSWHT